MTAPRVIWLVGTLLVLTSPAPARGQEKPREPTRSVAAAARSLVVPGWGQHSLGQRRGLAYALAEAAFWTLWAERRHKGGTLRTAYRDLAWREARTREGTREDPPWAYFEALSKWTRSGAFDGDPVSSGIQPELDQGTFNGSIWRLAVALYFPKGAEPDPMDEGYQAALAWYTSHAYGEAFLWDWSGREGPLAEYKDLIHRSDRRFSQATAALGAVLANHLLSAADAFVSSPIPGEARIRMAPRPSWNPSPLGVVLSWTGPW